MRRIFGWWRASRWNGTLLVVLDENAHLRLYDMATQRAGAALTGFPAGYPMWSRDGRYLYFESNSSTAWYRVGVEQRSVDFGEDGESE